jgi:hypothetical protein
VIDAAKIDEYLARDVVLEPVAEAWPDGLSNEQIRRLSALRNTWGGPAA